MKAEEVLTKVANEHSYEDWGECMYDTHPHSQIEYAIQAMREYARIQIEKDRQRIKKVFSEDYEKFFIDTIPIILDL